MSNASSLGFWGGAAILIAACLPGGAVAQKATNLVCDGCVGSTDIRDNSIKAVDLAAGVVAGTTVLVPVTSKPRRNCRNLRAAIDGVAPSAGRPALLKLPGVNYNCGTMPVVLRPFVTIEGAGRNATTIFGKVPGIDQGVVQSVQDSHLRGLRIRSTGAPSNSGSAVLATGKRVTISDAAIEVDAVDTIEAFGIRVVGGTLALTDVSIRSKSENGQSQGIRAESGSSIQLMNTWVVNDSDNFGNPAALELRDSQVTGFGILLSSNFFSLLGRGTSSFELFDGTLFGGRGIDGPDVTFSCVAIADADFTARGPDCS